SFWPFSGGFHDQRIRLLDQSGSPQVCILLILCRGAVSISTPLPSLIDSLVRVVAISADITRRQHSMGIETIGIVGAGTMGNGIAHVCIKAGFNVILVDVEQRFLDRGIATLT